MKKILTITLIAIFMGSLFAFLLTKNLTNSIETTFEGYETLTFFQAGAFKEEKNALEFAKTLESNTVVKEDEYYHVYIAILENPESVNIMQNYFKNKDINFYIVEKTVEKSTFTEDINKYQSLVSKVKQDSSLQVINQQILKSYEESTY